MNALTRTLMITCLVSLFVLGATTLYAGEGGTKMGKLVVTALPGTGHNLIVKSSVDVEAVFTDNAGKKEYYIGEMGYKLGVDLSIKSNEQLEYLVVSEISDTQTASYALQGKYFGQKASAQMKVGGGVQVLLGGMGKSISLQPLAVAKTEGYGVSAGLGYLYLQKDHRK